MEEKTAMIPVIDTFSFSLFTNESKRDKLHAKMRRDEEFLVINPIADHSSP